MSDPQWRGARRGSRAGVPWRGRGLLVTGTAIVSLAAAVAIAGPLLTPFDPAAQELPMRLDGPTLAHPFGLDELGRDILARVMAGARISFAVGLAVVIV